MATSGDLALGCMPGDERRWHAFAHLTLKLSGKRIQQNARAARFQRSLGRFSAR
jgi:hypothetical protein